MTLTLDPVALTVLQAALSGIADEMGVVLVSSAYSANIKERRDCSAAVFDRDGRMVAQAAHIPVHLGAMPEAVEIVLGLDPRPGDVFITNDPYAGSSHLPDITLVSSIDVDGEIVGFAATRAHHSEVGGMRTGSMPSDSREIFQEGLIIPPTRLVTAGEIIAPIWKLILANVRTPEVLAADLRAQIAANQVAQNGFRELFARYGQGLVESGFDAVLDHGEACARAAVAAIEDGVYAAETELEGDGVTEDDVPIRVAVHVQGDQLLVDFTGTSGAVTGNVNCPLAVTRAACLFALRLLLDKDAPMNGGVDRVLTLVAQPGSLVHAQSPSAVVAGNVETSQRIADAVMLALSAAVPMPALGQGTMNNVIIGGTDWSYYETIAGGQGASRFGPGDSAIHVGMTNTLNTPIEALEQEFPMRVERYEIRRGTGGAGRFPGGDGIVRSTRVLVAAEASLLTDRRRHAPRGAAGGRDGAVGRNTLNDVVVGTKASLSLAPGDVLTVYTPGGGGYGPADAAA